MAEIKTNYWIASLSLFVTALLVGSATYYLKPTGNYKVCDNGQGWTFNHETGKYDCGSDRSYDCVKVRNTKGGKPNYFCDDATRIEIKEEVKVVEIQAPATSCPKVRVLKYDYDGTKWLCNNEGQDCVRFKDLMDVNFR